MVDRFVRVPKKYFYAPLSHLNLAPNTVTWAGFVLGLLCATAAALGFLKAAFALWVANRFVDGLDGEIARAHGTQSDYGGYLDIICDFVVYTAIPIALVVQSPSESRWLLLALLLGSFFVNAASLMYLAALLEKRGLGASHQGEKTSITMPPALIEGAETVIFYSLFLLYPEYLNQFFALMAGLVYLNIAQRLVWASKHLRED